MQMDYGSSMKKNKNIVITAGGTGGHIFPALAVALEFRKMYNDVSLLWIGTTRNREVELCEKNGIPIVLLDVAGIDRRFTIKNIRALLNFVLEFFRMRALFKKKNPDAVIAFGGYVCAPVLAAARMCSIPYFIHEQNTVAGIVNRMFASKARRVFAGFPIAGSKGLAGLVTITGTPVRSNTSTYETFGYPFGFDKTKKTILICGGSQGAQSMNICLIDAVTTWLSQGFQVMWQTGLPGYEDVARKMRGATGLFVFQTINDLYPYYAAADVVVGRAGASTISEIAYFGLPCVLIPLPWATENHQWMNAGVVEMQGWGIRVRQDKQCGANTALAVQRILTDAAVNESMSRKSLDHAPTNAAATIVKTMISDCTL